MQNHRCIGVDALQGTRGKDLMSVNKIDKECVPLINAMNQCRGIDTIESCCGHGKSTFRIYFKPKRLVDLPFLLFYFDGCHTGEYGWVCRVRTDCAMSPVHFVVESSTMGKEAYKSANNIAKAINKANNGGTK